MSRYAINLLIDSGLITSSGKPINLSVLSAGEMSARVSQYINGRIQTINSEIESIEPSDKLNALFSTESTVVSRTNILSSAVIYKSIIIDDPLISAASTISYESLVEGLKVFTDYFGLIKADLLKVLPLSLFNRPSDAVPLLWSDDAFKSSIPKGLHDFIHDRAYLSSVVKDGTGRMLVLREDASVKRRPALNVGFKDDYWHRGVQLYFFKTIQDVSKAANGHMKIKQVWDPEKYLDKETFDRWSYQTINQAMRVRLRNIYNETSLASRLGYTYITESKFESELLALSGTEEYSRANNPCRFFDANKSLINVETPETVIELRDKYPIAFERFNSSLLYAVEHLKNVDPDNFEFKAQQYFDNEIRPQIDELRTNARNISRSAVKGVLVSLGGITTAILSGTTLPLIPSLVSVALGGISETLDSVGRHQDYKKSPVYIWHRITKN